MKSRKAIAAALLAAGLLLLAACPFRPDNRVKTTGTASRGLTLLQAVECAAAPARQWSPQASLVYVISTEAGEPCPDPEAGMNGRRRSWNVVFYNPAQGTNLLVAIHAGKTIYTREVMMAYTCPISRSDIRLDSPEAARWARPVLCRDQNPPSGFHFELLNRDAPVIRVYCPDPAGNSRIAQIDQPTGRLSLYEGRGVNQYPVRTSPGESK